MPKKFRYNEYDLALTFLRNMDKEGKASMFSIKKTSSSNKTLRLPDPLIERLERLAYKHDISFTQLVIQCCEYALDNMEEDDAETKK